MSLFSKMLGGCGTATPAQRADDDARRDAARARLGEWETALTHHKLPGFVTERLKEAAEGRQPWIATMTPAELLLARSHGVRPVATVSGTCWFHYGWSWTEGHSEGWKHALDRIGREAVAAGANAVVDVRMRTLKHTLASSMDFTLIGTAIRVGKLPPSPKPVIATVPAIEFMQLIEMGIVPTGIAVGAVFKWFTRAVSGMTMFDGNQELDEITRFWNRTRREAHAKLRAHAKSMGNGVLAHTQFGQLLKKEQGDKQPPAFLGRHIVIGTVVDAMPNEGIRQQVQTVMDMRDGQSPLNDGTGHKHTSYGQDHGEREEAI